MPGASEHTRRVMTFNANWVAGATEMCALIALTQAPALLLWDPAADTLIAANLVGRMPWTDRFEPPPG
jgi:hypothetical protein